MAIRMDLKKGSLLVSEKPKYAFVCGNNMDKGDLGDVESWIARDRDISHLIYRGRLGNLKRLALLVFLLVGAIMGVTSLMPEISGALLMSTPIVGLIALAVSVQSCVSDIKDATQGAIEARKYIRYILGKQAPRRSSEIWHYIPGSVADAQMMVMAQKIIDNQLCVYYSGMPYYSLKYLDSIEIRWTSSAIKHHYRYMKTLNEFCMRTYAAHADCEYFKNDCKRIEASNAVFGVLFFSTYLERELSRSKTDRLRVKVAVPENRMKLVVEFIRLCSDPSVVEFVDASEPDADCDIIVVHNACCPSEARRHSGFRTLHIPVKRIVALSANKNSPLPLPICEKKPKAVFIGGAEQNLALQTVINYLKWTPNEDASINRFRIDFAENMFATGSTNVLLVGTEGLVYGVRDSLYSRQRQAPSGNLAEVYHLIVDDVHVYGVMGYSAQMTKIALAEFLGHDTAGQNAKHESVSPRGAPASSQDDGAIGFEKWIPGLASFVTEQLIYHIPLEEGQKLFQTDDGESWDAYDVVNDVKQLDEWLRKCSAGVTSPGLL